MTDTDWLHGYLGDFYNMLTEEQRGILAQASEQIGERWPDPDLADVRNEALTAVTMILFGDATDEGIAAAWFAARWAEREAHAQLTGAIIAGQLLNPSETETSQASRLGVTRVTLRKALGR